MRHEPRKWYVQDYSGKTKGGELSVGWSAEAGARFARLRLGDNEIVCAIDQLASLLFLLSSEAERADWARKNMTTVQARPVKLEVTATRDIQKGEKISFFYEVKRPVWQQ